MNYHYPIDESWSKKEIEDVVAFFNVVEQAYENKVNKQKVLDAYNRFKEIIPSKSEEKQHFKAFEQASGYKSYQVVKRARETDAVMISMQ